ncbi:MAG: 50S ribosomal protein L11 methyltransferase [Prevotella sp.]|nr:50S ribosomal protein L11 methyltransferase [Prevotella sp.]
MNWTEVNIFTTSEGIDPVCGCLLGIGVTGFVIKDSKDFEEFLADKTGNWDYIDDDLMNLRDCETCVTVYLPDDTQGADMLSALRSEMSALAERDTDKAFGRLAVELANVREEDWANNWKQYFKPLTVGEKLVIKPSWEEYDGDDERTVLEIDPASSFGTGQHNTTQLCLELIEENLRPGDRLLDLGCGSGILSIAAMLLGAKEVTAVDVSQNSVETAKENAAKNNIPAEKYRAYCGDILSDSALVEKIGGGYDIIAANIVADVLIAMSPLFEKFLKKGGTLILSGIITERCDEVIDAVIEQGYSINTLKSKDGWAAVSFHS